MMYNDFKTHLVKKGETVSGIAAQYGVLEDALITTNPNISLTQSPGSWFRSFKWVASVKEGDTLRIPFYNQDKARKGVKAISGKTSVKPGEWEQYTVTEWYGGTPLEDRNEDRVKWELYLLQTGKAPEKVLEKETGHFRFMEKAVGERFKVVAYLYQPELDNNSALTVKVIPTQKREILQILLKDAQFNPISGPLSYGQKLNVYVSATGMVGEYIHLSLWEGDAKAGGHSQQNQANPTLVAEASVRVSMYGIASCTFLIKPDFAKMAKAHMSSSEDSKHEYYVTAYADEHQEGAASDHLIINNPAPKRATPQVRQQKIKEHLAERKAPKRNEAIPAASKAIIQSKTIDVDVKSFNPDKPDGVSVVKVGKADVPHSASVVKADTKYLKSAYWSNQNAKEITCLLYSVKTVYVCVNLLKPAKGKKISISYKEYNAIRNTDLNKKISYAIPNDNLQQLCPVNFTINDYTIEDEDDVAEYIFEIKIDDEEYTNSSKKLKVHAVIYVPEIMKSLGWSYAFKSQDDWFNGDKNNYPWESLPKQNDFTMEWALGFERFKKHYDKHLNKWKSEVSLDLLRKEISKMVKDGYAAYPTAQVKKTTFGLQNIADPKIVDHFIEPEELDKKQTKIKVPLFDKYYFTGAVYEEVKSNPLDDFYGSVANCNLRFTAKGTLEYKNAKETEVTITEIGIYIRDGFDFSDGKRIISQPLGYWSLKQKKVKKEPIPLIDDYRLINNESYRNYRKDTGKGEDFYRYSTMNIDKPNFKFKL